MARIQLTIDDVAFGGNGVGRKNGKAFFVPFTIDGETVSAEVVGEKKRFAEAKLLTVREPSAHRVTPECPYFGRCGGCSYQHIDYEHQLSIKWRQVRDILQRIGKLPQPPMRPIIPSPLHYRYRNRITVHAQDGVIGFFRRDSHSLIDIERCPISTDEVNLALTQLRQHQVRDGHYTLRGSSAPRVFSQTNDSIANTLRDLVATFIPADQQLLIDAYCGAGFFAKALLDKFERVIGIDWDKFAIEEARKNATAKETYIAADVEIELAKVGAVPLNRPPHANLVRPGRLRSIAPTLIVDPSAAGLTPNVRRIILDMTPETLIYVSCNPATFARDLPELQQRFTIESITPFDMFPQTSEIEAVGHLRRKPADQSPPAKNSRPHE
jgi:tRNA/tmRNA/rRNA uracil-C5-methylase (TrmA/RlmC/RlmD family)